MTIITSPPIWSVWKMLWEKRWLYNRSVPSSIWYWNWLFRKWKYKRAQSHSWTAFLFSVWNSGIHLISNQESSWRYMSPLWSKRETSRYLPLRRLWRIYLWRIHTLSLALFRTAIWFNDRALLLCKENLRSLNWKMVNSRSSRICWRPQSLCLRP